ncbi:unnamed protein product, partial [marine sediment metagenome]
MIKPESTDLQASGRDIVKNTLRGDAPRVRAAFSSRSGTAVKPSLAPLIRKGRLTNAMATIIPAGLPINEKPAFSANFPVTLFLEITPSTAIPAAECGITTGKSIIPVIRRFSGKFLRANRYEKGTAKNERIRV